MAFTGIFATLVGLFGVSGIAATQQVVIDGLFGGIVQSVGMKMGMYALVLLEGSYLTVLLYPSMTHFSALGLFRSKEMGTLLKACWALLQCASYLRLFTLLFSVLFFSPPFIDDLKYREKALCVMHGAFSIAYSSLRARGYLE